MNTISDIIDLDDVLDTRDLLLKRDELFADRQSLVYDVNEAKENLEQAPFKFDASKPDIENDDDVNSDFEEDQTALNDAQEAFDDAETALKDWDEENAEAFADLERVIDECNNITSETRYGATLISDHHFNDAMDQDMEEFGYIPKDLPPFLTITVDYDALQQDYSSVFIGDENYWIRNS